MGNRSGRVSVRWPAIIAGVVAVAGCGGSNRLEFHENRAGNFRVLAAGKPGQSSQAVASPAGPLGMNATESVDGDRIRRLVVYTDLPGPLSLSGDPNALLDAGIRAMSGKGQWTVQSQNAIALDGHPGREIRFAVNPPAAPEKGTGRARIFLVGNRLYQAIMVGPASKVGDEDLDHFVKSFELLQKVPATAPAVATGGGPAVPPAAAAPPAGPIAASQPAPAARALRPTMTRTPAQRPPRAAPSARTNRRQPAADQPVQVGDTGPDPSGPAEVAIEAAGPIGTPIERPKPGGREEERFLEAAPERGLLVGLRAGYVEIFGGPKVATIQPIYQVARAYVEGTAFGKPQPTTMRVVARPGYAVGGLITRTGLTVDAFRVVFMRFKDGQLDPGDSYTSDWLGDPRGGGLGEVKGEGKLVVGIHGRTNGREINGLGLLIAE